MQLVVTLGLSEYLNNYDGVYNGAQTYTIGKIVEYEGALYMARVTVPEANPPTAGENNTHWWFIPAGLVS